MTGLRCSAVMLALLPILGATATADDPGRILWTRGDKIHRARFDGSHVYDLVDEKVGGNFGVAYDPLHREIFWTNANGGTIRRCKLNGMRVQTIVSGIADARGIVVDPEGGKLYWTDNIRDKIERSDLDGKHREDIVTGGLASPIGLALDAKHKKIYWVETDLNKIERANLDGSQREALITSGLARPEGIAIDAEAGKMFFANSALGKIESADLDGKNRREIFSRPARDMWGLAVDPTEQLVFWVSERVECVSYSGTGHRILSANRADGIVAYRRSATDPKERDLPKPPGE